MKHVRQANGPFLIIVPKSTLQNWMNEFERWCPTIRSVCLIGTEEERKAIIAEKLIPNTYDVRQISLKLSNNYRVF